MFGVLTEPGAMVKNLGDLERIDDRGSIMSDGWWMVYQASAQLVALVDGDGLVQRIGWHQFLG